MVFTLHRYIFRELFKVFVLAVVALSLILSLGSILLPVQQYGLGPRQAVHLMGYFMPITLTFVLPIAALFAGALVYGRFASDNELDACKASGISLLTLVCPGLALAIMVAIANLILSFYITPIFVHLAEKSLKADAKQILFRNLKQKGYYKLPQDERWYLIYADYADSQNNTLLGVIVAEGKSDKMQKITTVDSASVYFDPHEKFNEVRITARNPYHFSPEDGLWFSSDYVSFTREFGSLLEENIKFKKVDEMKAILVDPMRFDPIARLAYRTYAQFAADLLAQDIIDKISGDAPHKLNTNRTSEISKDEPAAFGQLVRGFYSLHSGDKFVEFTANSCKVKDEREIELSEEVVVMEYNLIVGAGKVEKKPFRTLNCTRALLHIEGEESSPVLTVAIELYSPLWQQADGQKGTAIGWIRIQGLVAPNNIDIKERFGTGYTYDAIREASKLSMLRSGPSVELKKLQYELRKSVKQTLSEISAELHSRLVFGIGCVPMILIGIGLGVIKRGGHLLSAFAASCLPAALLILAIISGKNVTENLGSQSISGIVIMWAGLAILTLLAVVIYRKELRT